MHACRCVRRLPGRCACKRSLQEATACTPASPSLAPLAMGLSHLQGGGHLHAPGLPDGAQHPHHTLRRLAGAALLQLDCRLAYRQHRSGSSARPAELDTRTVPARMAARLRRQHRRATPAGPARPAAALADQRASNQASRQPCRPGQCAWQARRCRRWPQAEPQIYPAGAKCGAPAPEHSAMSRAPPEMWAYE